MSPEEQKRLGAFLAAQDCPTVEAYLGLPPSPDKESQEKAIEDRRVWAQEQQTNPKFQDEAIWVLSHLPVLREALRRPIEELLWLEAAEPDDGETAGALNHYELLGIEPTASTQEIEDAHRLRYRDARHKKNRHEAHKLYAALDEAWDTLSDPKKRANYDELLRANPIQLKATPQDSADTSPSLSDRQILTQSPNLVLRGEQRIERAIGRKAIQQTIVFEREGPGLVDATIRCDQAWLQTDIQRLNPHYSSHKIQLTIDPKKIPGLAGLGQVVLQNFNGQRIAIHVRATRTKSTSKLFLISGAIALFLGAAFWFTRSSGEAPDALPPAGIEVHVQSPQAIVFLEGHEKASGETIHRFSPIPTNQPLVLRVTQPGYQEYRTRILPEDAKNLIVPIKLKPKAP